MPKDLGQPEQADHDRNKVQTAHHRNAAEGVPRHAADHVDPNGGQQHPQAGCHQPLGRAARTDQSAQTETEDGQPESFVEAELQGELGQQGSDRDQQDNADQSAERRTEQIQRQRQSASPLLGHLMTVQNRRRRCRRTGNA